MLTVIALRPIKDTTDDLEFIRHDRITSVLADTVAQGVYRLERELDKVGREGYYRAWVDGGRVIAVEYPEL